MKNKYLKNMYQCFAVTAVLLSACGEAAKRKNVGRQRWRLQNWRILIRKKYNESMNMPIDPRRGS